MTRFARRATTIAAALIAAPLGFALVTTAGPQALAAGAPVSAGVAHVVEAVGAQAADDAAAKTSYTSKKKKKKKSAAKKTPAKTPAKTPTKTPAKTPTTTPTKPATPVTTAPAAPTTGQYAAMENEVVTLTNNYRQANGCGALRIDGRLVTAARAHSTDMVTKNYFDHTGSDGSNFVQREAAAGYTTGASAENIAWGYRTAQDVVTGWINSPGHRANILNCQSVAVGVGLAYKADGTPYWTQDFGRV
ncbi:CAP domain-containing protein [Dactylosporangium sp. CA-052675]|uniref:CAP domain-containing protein n=1 Tax=Dactylosporangium sp. CA-052675 TaxID=3239927 RepID=UPI003D90EA6D